MCGGQVSEHLEKTEYKMNKLFPGIFAMAIIVVASNILVQFFIGNWLTWGAFTYPFAFLVTDLINRMYGSADARRVVFFGFIIGIVSSLIGTQINIEIAPDFMAQADAHRIENGSDTAASEEACMKEGHNEITLDDLHDPIIQENICLL